MAKDESDDIQDELYDPDYEYGEDFETTSIEEMLVQSPEDMEEPRFLSACFLAKQQGQLPTLLSVFSITSPEGVTQVEQILDQHYPTLLHQTDSLFEMMEQELARLSIGNATRIGEMDTQGLVLDVKSEDRRVQALALLFNVRAKRLELRPLLETLDNGRPHS